MSDTQQTRVLKPGHQHHGIGRGAVAALVITAALVAAALASVATAALVKRGPQGKPGVSVRFASPATAARPTPAATATPTAPRVTHVTKIVKMKATPDPRVAGLQDEAARTHDGLCAVLQAVVYMAQDAPDVHALGSALTVARDSGCNVVQR